MTVTVTVKAVRRWGAHGFPSFPPLLTREWVVNTTKNFLYCFVICIRKFFCAVAHSCWSHKRCQQKKWSASQKLPTMLANPNKAWRVGHFDLTNESDSWAPHLRTAPASSTYTHMEPVLNLQISHTHSAELGKWWQLARHMGKLANLLILGQPNLVSNHSVVTLYISNYKH